MKRQTTTKELILTSALEMINETGVIDFRIDVLALSLNLSPGNVTYHFARKEDIVLTLWNRHLEQVEGIATSISSLLDIKQAYLLFLQLCKQIYKFRGVIMFVCGDKRVINDSQYNTSNFFALVDHLYAEIEMTLATNGYIKANSSGLSPLSTIATTWWINLCTINEKTTLNKGAKSSLSTWAILLLYTLSTLFTEKGESEFDFLETQIG